MLRGWTASKFLCLRRSCRAIKRRFWNRFSNPASFFKRVSEIVFCVYEIGLGFRLSAARCSPSPFLKWDFCVYEIRILFYKTVSEISRESSQAMFFNFVSPGGPQFEISERGAVRKIVIVSGSPPAHRLERRAWQRKALNNEFMEIDGSACVCSACAMHCIPIQGIAHSLAWRESNLILRQTICSRW